MKRCHFFSIIFLQFCTAGVFASDTQDIERLRSHVLEATEEHYRQAFGEEMFNSNVQIHVGQLDRRLRLAKCDNNLTFKIHEPAIRSHNITVKTSCTSKHRWTVYVPATIDIFANVVTTNTSLQRGDILQRSHLAYKRTNIATLGHSPIEDKNRAVGMQLKRPVKSGEIIRFSGLEKPNIVSKGQSVVLSSQSSALSIETAGIALVSGHLGQNIKVKNTSSNRVVHATVVAPGKVTVTKR